MAHAEDITILETTIDSPLYQQIWNLRDAVLRKPLGRSLKDDDMSRDYVDTFFVAMHDNKVIGCVLVHPLEAGVLQLRAMAVYDEWQGRGVGRLLVGAAEKFALRKNCPKIILHARKVALGFYSGMGYAITSDEFTEVGIPHFMMEKVY